MAALRAHRLPPSHGEGCSVPGQLALGQAWKLSGMGVGGHILCFPEMLAIPHPHTLVLHLTACSRTPSGTRCGSPILALTLHNQKGTERVHDLPRVTQHISERDRSPINRPRI